MGPASASRIRKLLYWLQSTDYSNKLQYVPVC
jgi:hypothetical protein